VHLFQQDPVPQLEGVERLRCKRRESGLERRQPGSRAELVVEESVVEVEQDRSYAGAASPGSRHRAATV
jgi:hypothetical protein